MLLDYTLHRIDIYIYKKRQIRVTAKPSTNARTIYLVEQQRPNKSGSYIETTVWFIRHAKRSDFPALLNCFMFFIWLRIDSNSMHASANERRVTELIANQSPHFKYQFENPADLSTWSSSLIYRLTTVFRFTVFRGIKMIIFIVPKCISHFKAQKRVLKPWPLKNFT